MRRSALIHWGEFKGCTSESCKFISLRYQGHVLGTLEFQKPLSRAQHEQAQAIADLLTELSCWSESLAHDWRGLEERMITHNQIFGDVVPIERGLRRQPSPTWAWEEGLFSQTDQRWIQALPVLIESPNALDIQKLALELHLRSQRYAFLLWSEVEPRYREDPKAVMALGSVTLFVPLVSHLKNEEVDAITQVLSQSALQPGPLFMFGTQTPFADLLRTGLVKTSLLEHLSSSYLRMDHPFEHYKDRGIFRFFLDGLFARPSLAENLPF